MSGTVSRAAFERVKSDRDSWANRAESAESELRELREERDQQRKRVSMILDAKLDWIKRATLAEKTIKDALAVPDNEYTKADPNVTDPSPITYVSPRDPRVVLSEVRNVLHRVSLLTNQETESQ